MNPFSSFRTFFETRKSRVPLLLSLVACGSLWSQTPSGALYLMQQSDLATINTYVDFTVSNSEFRTFTSNGGTLQSLGLLLSHSSRSDGQGTCWDFRFYPQYGATAPDWSIWYETDFLNKTYALASDNVDGVLPRQRLWIGNGGGFEGPSLMLRTVGNIYTPKINRGAAWMAARQLEGYTQVQCENASYSTLRWVNKVFTKIR